MQEDVNEVLEIRKTTDSQRDALNLPVIAFVMSLIAIPLQIIFLLLNHYMPAGIVEHKVIIFFTSLLISALAFLLSGIVLFNKTQSKKYAILAMIISVLSVIAFFVLIFIEVINNFPA